MCRLPAPVVVSLPVPLLYLAVTLPLLAVGPVPSTTALQLGPLSVAWMPVMVPVVTQLLNDSDEILPMPVPDSPLPDLTEPLPLEDAQVRVLPVLVSFSVVVPALAVMAPPGLTVQVAATPLIAAIALPALRPSTPVRAALVTRTLPARLRIMG